MLYVVDKKKKKKVQIDAMVTCLCREVIGKEIFSFWTEVKKIK